MAKGNVNKVILGIANEEITFLYSPSGKTRVITDSVLCAGNSEWRSAIDSLFSKYKVQASCKVIVVLAQGMYTVVQLPKNERLTDEELTGIAMVKDLEPAVQGRVLDYTWDFYDAKTGKNSKPTLNFVLVEKKLIAMVAEIVNDYATLEKITVFDLAMTEFISYYQAASMNKIKEKERTPYVPQLCLTLYLQKDKELTVYGVYGGELCYSRVLRGYRSLATDLITGADDPKISRLTTEILRITDDFFTSRLGLPPMSKLLLVMNAEQLKNIAVSMSQNFRRVVDVIPINSDVESTEAAGYSVCKNTELVDVLKKDLSFAPLLGIWKEGILVSEKN
ncbi:hypothetical protein [Ruminobacter sp.]|uniref:hypothetical protein n=1 Tax=Ruminobacter sp. TaxID=2774296 RepID=UPI001B68D7B2|nr:hypothetical protein [Ruminobacter sp.]MBP3748112.1 hypothetical protein [Ruminobacter sp.]